MSNLIFISSTYRDLKDHREAVIKYLESTHTAFDAMEFFGSNPNTPLDTCLEKVRQSKILVLIIAFSYGSVDKDSGKSYTQLEYEEAKKHNIPVYAYIMDDKSQKVLDENIDKGELRDKLDKFLEAVKCERTISKFTTPDNLALEVARDIYNYAFNCAEAQRLSTKTGVSGDNGKTSKNGNYGAQTNWKAYNGIFQIEGYHVAYIPIVNAPVPNNGMNEYGFDDLGINLSYVPYQLPKNFSTDDDFVESGSKCCRLCSYQLPDSRIELRLSETRYIDYMRSGERLDYPSKDDPDKTYREVFGSRINPGQGDFNLFDLTNICGCGMFILTSDQYLLASLHPDDTRVYPGRWTFAASGTMKFGNYPHPFTEILHKTREEINHQVDLSQLKLLNFGADARKLFFQFSFLEESNENYTQIVEKCREKYKDLEFKAIPFNLATIVRELAGGLWEPAAEAFLLTLCIQRFSYDAVRQELISHRKKWGRREILDEWDYRASHGSVSATLSIRYPKNEMEKISKDYIDAIITFMGRELKGKDVLEVGSGDGRITEHLAKEAKSVTCVDICDKMIKKSKDKLKGYPGKVTHHKAFVQDFHAKKTYDVALVSQVLIHNVDDEDFLNFISKVVKCANAIYVFEDVTQDRKTGLYTKLRKENEIIQAFCNQGCALIESGTHEMHEDRIAMLKFEKR